MPPQNIPPSLTILCGTIICITIHVPTVALTFQQRLNHIKNGVVFGRVFRGGF